MELDPTALHYNLKFYLVKTRQQQPIANSIGQGV